MATFRMKISAVCTPNDRMEQEFLPPKSPGVDQSVENEYQIELSDGELISVYNRLKRGE